MSCTATSSTHHDEQAGKKKKTTPLRLHRRHECHCAQFGGCYSGRIPASRKHVKVVIAKLLEWSGIVCWAGTDRLTVQNVQIPVSGLDESLEGFRVVHITDLHAHSLNSALIDRVVRQTNELNADLVLLTGDYIMADPGDYTFHSSSLCL